MIEVGIHRVLTNVGNTIVFEVTLFEGTFFDEYVWAIFLGLCGTNKDICFFARVCNRLTK